MKALTRLFQPLSLPTSGSTALLLLRLIAGSAFMIHGWGKMQAPFAWMGPDAPVPGLFQFLATLSEFGGGLAWILGLLTPLGSLGIWFTMTTAVCTHFLVFKDPFVSLAGARSAELPSVFWAVSLVLMFVGPGRFSLDMKIFGARR